MSTTPRVVGTLVVVVYKAQHLPNKRHIGKQDPYCRVTFNGQVQRTRAIKRGGQHPEWDEEVRFTLYEDTDDAPEPIPKDGASPPPPPPKATAGKKLKRVKGGNSMQVACFADDPKEPDLIGETVVDLTEVLTKGETDEWFTLLNKDKFSGEVYLEMTFWSNEKPPEKKAKAVGSRIDVRNGYGGPGSFVPSDGSPAGKDIPAALRASGSLAKLDLYVPPYDTSKAPTRRQGSDIDQVVDEFSVLGFNQPHHQPQRRESFPPLNAGHARPSSDSFSQHSSSWSSSTYPLENSAQPWSAYPSGAPEGSQPWLAYQSPSSSIEPPSSYPHDYNAPTYGLPSSSSGFVPVSSTPVPSSFYGPPSVTPAPSGFAPYPPQPGFGHQGSHIPTSSGFAPPPSATPVPSGFAPPPSAMGFHNNAVQTNYPYQTYPPQPSSAPNLAYPPPTPQPGVPPVSHSAPPQQFQDAPHPVPNGLPLSSSYSGGHSPVQVPQQQPYQVIPSPTYGVPQPYPQPTTTPSPPQTYQPQVQAQPYQPSPPMTNGRPLPLPGQVSQVTSSISFPGTPPHTGGSTMSNPSTPARSNSSSAVYTNTPPRPPLPNPPMQSSQSSGPSGFVPPPPPPPLNPRLSAPPPPPPQLRESTSPVRQSPLGHPVTRRSSLPIPPTGIMGKPPLPPPPTLQPGGQHFPPPPPPPTLPPVHEDQQHPLPYVPQAASNGASIQVGQIYPGPPPRPPVLQSYTSAPLYGAPPQY